VPMRQGLIAFGTRGQYRIGPQNSAQVLGTVTDGARNVDVSRIDAVPGSPVQVLRAGGRLLYASGRTVRELSYRLERDTLEAADLTVLAEHIFPLGAVEAAWQSAPDSTAWFVLPQGELAALSYAPEQAVVAWSRHQIGAAVRSLCAVPSHEDEGDALYMIVDRYDGAGNPLRFVEYLSARWRIGDPVALSRHVDAHVVLEFSSETNQPTGAAHLYGLAVRCLVDGVEYETVWLETDTFVPEHNISGRIWIVGIPYRSAARLLEPIVAAGRGEPSIGHVKAIARIRVGVADSGPLFLRHPGGAVRLVGERDAGATYGAPTRLLTGHVEAPVPAGFGRDALLEIYTDHATPTVLRYVGVLLEAAG